MWASSESTMKRCLLEDLQENYLKSENTELLQDCSSQVTGDEWNFFIWDLLLVNRIYKLLLRD